MNDIPEGYKEVENITGVYIDKRDGEIVVCGIPDEEDENHDCDQMGCSSISHVLYRSNIFK